MALLPSKIQEEETQKRIFDFDTNIECIPTFLVIMITYTIDTKELEDVVFRFGAHHEASVPVIHHIFNTFYNIDLYDIDFNFFFNDVAKNGLTELYKKDASERLLANMVVHIKTT